MENLLSGLPATWQAIILIVLAVLGGGITGWILAKVLLHWMHSIGLKHQNIFAQSAHRNLSGPIKLYFVLIGMLIFLGIIDNEEFIALDYTARIVEIILYGATAWLIVQLVEVAGDLLLRRYSYTGSSDNFEQRKAYTQVLYIKRVVTFLAVLIAFALVLFQFDGVRELGTGLLASAGIAGIIIGVAAQKSLSNLLAGFQIAFTQPLRIDDQVVIDGEFGRVEEITLTYVVVKIWDERRLIVPLNKIIDDTFQNWSRHSTELIGAIMLYLDYGVNLEALRTEAQRIAETDELWDQRLIKVQVTDTSEEAMTVRILVSAANPGNAFTLRCNMREGLLGYLRQNDPQAFPLRRAAIASTQSEDIPDTGSDEPETDLL